MFELDQRIQQLLATRPYSLPPAERECALVTLLREELEYACRRNPQYANYVCQWPVKLATARRISDFPYLPVGLFKSQTSLSLVEPQQIKRTLTSSSTTGQTPSRIAIDAPTARRMTKGVVAILQDFIGLDRRPYLVVDVPDTVRAGAELGARGAAIQGLRPFATEIAYCLQSDTREDLQLDRDRLLRFADAHRDSAVLVYGFTYVLWKYLVLPLMKDDICLGVPNVYILHSGGWKLLQKEAVNKTTFNDGLARVFGCSPDRIIDFYGMVENVGVIYPDCVEGHKHVPAFGDVIVRNPLTLEPVAEGEQGIAQVCSVLPTSFPGHLLLTEDLAEVICYDGCRCGRKGTCFRFAGRVPKSEVRGCGNIERKRLPADPMAYHA